MIPHLSRVKATRLNKSNRVIVWWGPVVPRHWVKRPPNWFHWRANSDLNPVFQRWKRAIDFRHSQFKTEMITILTVSDCTLHGKWVPLPTGSSFSLDWNLCCTSRREHKVTGQWAAAGNYGDRYLSLQVNEAVKMWEQLVFAIRNLSWRNTLHFSPQQDVGKTTFVTRPLLQVLRSVRRKSLSVNGRDGFTGLDWALLLV